MEEEILFERLVKFCFGKAMSILCLFINAKVLQNGRFELFLNNFKHEIFHQWIPNFRCCQCNPYKYTPSRAALTEPQMAKLYELPKTVNTGHEKRNPKGKITEHCICGLKALPDVETKDADIGTLYCILRICDKTNFLRVKQQLEVIRTMRNEISHSASRTFTENKFNKKWKELETAVLDIANEVNPSIKVHEAKQIAELKVADVTQEKLNTLMKVCDENKKQLECILNIKQQEAAPDPEIREHAFNIENLLIRILYEHHHTCSNTQSQSSWKCCFCLPSNGSRYLADAHLSDEETNPLIQLTKWAMNPPGNWDVQKIKEKLKTNSCSLKYLEKESTDNRNLVFGKEFPRQLVENHKKLISEIESGFKQTFEAGEIDVKTTAEITVNWSVEDIPCKRFDLKNTVQIPFEKAANHPIQNIADIKTFKDERIVIADKNLHLLKLFYKGQEIQTIRLDGGPTSLDIIDDSTVCVTLPQESIVAIVDVNRGETTRKIHVDGKCCSIMYTQECYVVGCENRTLIKINHSSDENQIFKLPFEPSGICGKIFDNGRILCMLCQITQDNKIYRIETDIEGKLKYHEHVSLKQTIGTVHFGLTIDDEDNLLYLDNNEVFKAYNDAANTLVLSPYKKISCMHYDISSKAILLVTIGGEILFYEHLSTRL
ncbi:uncharacterized protein LOC134689846 [Mytilus trossulus]|uniref:uncharacterized protein LOC134689846 n=1 Tax=Mytilus trossulus TaxID=6551 RepID=UPI003006C541